MEQSFDSPIPGMGMTHEVGARPWQTPPSIVTVQEGTDYYVERMGTEEFKKKLIDVIEIGVPLTTLANTIQLASVMEGVHTVDVGILMIPIIVELMITIAESANIEYKTGMEGMGDDSPTAINKFMIKKLQEKEMEERDTPKPQEEEVQQVEQEEQPQTPMGLMARRN